MAYWAGKHGLITGGSSGLGRALAHAAAGRGLAVTLVGRDAGKLAAAVESINAFGGDARAIAADLSVAGEAARVAREADAAAPLGFVCHAAGVSARGEVAGTPRGEHERLLALNYLAAAELAGAVAEPLAERSGRLVLIGSLASRVAPAYLSGYPASKHALAALAQQLRMELGPRGLRTLLVCPGPIARPDAGARYDAEAAGLPDSARAPGGGAKVRALDPDRLANQILDASQAGRAELVRPLKARLLFALSAISPAVGDWLLRRSMRR